MNLKLEGRTALVTGSTAGIGVAIAQALASEGAHVVVNGRTQQRVDAARGEIREKMPEARIDGIAADLGSSAGCDSVVRKFPEIDILVNNLGIFEPKPFEQIPDSEWNRFFEVNVMSGVRLSRAYLPGMKKRNWGRIVFISSESGVQIPAEMVHYGMTKAAQIAIGRRHCRDVCRDGHYREQRAGRADGLRRSDGICCIFGERAGPFHGRVRKRILSERAPEFVAQAIHHAGRGGRGCGLRLFPGRVSDQRHRPSRRWWGSKIRVLTLGA
jgi:NADP-dependent 3-hydroxy acid dehydrogenase YdfG